MAIYQNDDVLSLHPQRNDYTRYFSRSSKKYSTLETQINQTLFPTVAR